jgi:hypothetical protein
MSLFNKYLTIIQEAKIVREKISKNYSDDRSERRGILTIPMSSHHDLERQDQIYRNLATSKAYQFKDEENLSDYEIQQRIQSDLLKRKEKEIQAYVDPEAELKAKKAKIIYSNADLSIKLKNNITIDMKQVYEDPSFSYTYTEYMYTKGKEKEIDDNTKEKLENSILRNSTYYLKYTVLTQGKWSDKNRFKANQTIVSTLQDIKKKYPCRVSNKLQFVYELSLPEIDYFKEKYSAFFDV